MIFSTSLTRRDGLATFGLVALLGWIAADSWAGWYEIHYFSSCEFFPEGFRCPAPLDCPSDPDADDYYCENHVLTPKVCIFPSSQDCIEWHSGPGDGPTSLGGCGYKKHCIDNTWMEDSEGAFIGCTERREVCAPGVGGTDP